MDEFTGGVDFGFTRDLTVRFTVVRKLDWGGSKELNLAMPYEAYTDYRTGVDPGRDNVVGTADDGTIDVWSVPRTYPTFGQINQFTTNTEPNEGEDKYWAIETTVSRRLSGGWSFLGSYMGSIATCAITPPSIPTRRVTTGSSPEVRSRACV